MSFMRVSLKYVGEEKKGVRWRDSPESLANVRRGNALIACHELLHLHAALLRGMKRGLLRAMCSACCITASSERVKSIGSRSG